MACIAVRNLPARRSELTDIKGRRIFTVEGINEIMQSTFQHAKACTLPGSTIVMSSEKIHGLETSITFQCTCGYTFQIGNDSGRVSVPIYTS